MSATSIPEISAMLQRRLRMTALSLVAASDPKPRAFIESWLDDASVTSELATIAADADAEAIVMADVGWVFYRLGTSAEVSFVVPRVSELSEMTGFSDEIVRFCRILSVWVSRFRFDHKSLLALLNKHRSLFVEGDLTPQYMELFARCGSNGMDALGDAKTLVNRAAIEGHSDKMLHIAFQGLWLVPARTTEDGERIAELMREVRRLFSKNELGNPNIYYRMARERLLSGDHKGALENLDLAIQGTEDSGLAESYIREKSNLILSIDLATQMRRIRDEEVREIKNSTEHLTSRFESRVDSAIAFNLQLILGLVAIVGVGGFSFGISQSLYNNYLNIEPKDMTIPVIVTLCGLLATSVVAVSIVRWAVGSLRDSSSHRHSSPES
jgi:hypothetical protein